MELAHAFLGRVAAQNVHGKDLEGGGVGQQVGHGRIQIGQEGLEVRDRGAAVDAIGYFAHLNLAGMAGGAVHADPLVIDWPIGGKAHRQIRDRRVIVAQVTITDQVVGEKRGAVWLLQRAEPGQGHEAGALVDGVEQRPADAGPGRSPDRW